MLRAASLLCCAAVLRLAVAQETTLPAALEALRSMGNNAKPSPAKDWAAPWKQATAAAAGQPGGGGTNTRASVAARDGRTAPDDTSAADDAGAAVRARAAEAAAASEPVPATCRAAATRDAAVVTLISSNEGYPAGALAIAASLEVLGSTLRRIALVTPAVTQGIRETLHAGSWEVIEVDEVQCNQVMGAGITSGKYDLGGDYQSKRLKWLTTCTKFHAWNLLQFRKVLFLDADVLPLKEVDSLLEHPSAFAAAPDTFPADQFNSGVMVIEPSATRFDELLRWNAVNGTAEGGDQCLLNDFYGEWYYNAWDDAQAGRLPWIMNVAAPQATAYKTLMRMQSRDEPAIVHFVGGGTKPWILMMMQLQGMAEQIPPDIRALLHVWNQLYWLAKTNRICTGTLTDDEKAQARQLLDNA